MTRDATVFAALCTLAVVAIVLGVRWFGPHDLYEKDQPKTMAYTADVVLNHRFALPRDVIYQPATKPPMYNWIGAAVVQTTGVWSEWTLKCPSVLGVLATGAIVFAMARRATQSVDTAAVIVGLLAVGVWFTFGSNVRHGSVLRLSYLARPDMLLCAFVTGAWACFTIAIERPTLRKAFAPAVGGWLCVTAAALTKGPAALMPIAFALLYPLLLSRAPTVASDERNGAEPHTPFTPVPQTDGLLRRYARLWLPLGLPIVVLGVGTWLTFIMRQDETHFRQVIWGAEVASRLTEKSPEGFVSPPYQSVMWFVTKAQPWGAIALGGLLASVCVPRLRRIAGPAALYLAIVLIGLSLPAGKRQDYLLVTYPPAAVLLAVFVADLVRFRVVAAAALVGLVGVMINESVWLALRLNHSGITGRIDWPVLGAVGVLAVLAFVVERRRRLPLAAFAVVPLLLAAMLGRQHWTKSIEAQSRWSDRAVAFAADVRRIVRPDQRLLVLVRGKHPLTTLLGRHPGSYLTRQDLAASEFVILPVQPDLQAERLSGPLPVGFETLETRELAVLGLYRNVPIDRLVELQRRVGVWTAEENPYHAPDTVYRED
ncbi:MAG TPA: hypothetical protein VF595_12305 [Tepidisphaeraceae bacterium]